jgi:hypothetical protein
MIFGCKQKTIPVVVDREVVKIAGVPGQLD